MKMSAGEAGQKRLKRVRRWHSKPASSQVLRRGSLVLQLTSCMETFMSTNPKEGDPPIVVAIHQNKAHDLLQVLRYDTDLNLAAATSALFAIAVNLIARLTQYLKYSYK